MAKAKTINLLLNDGSLNGIISMEDSSWNKGELYSASRESVEDLLSIEACSRYGGYLLLSEDMVYIGQSSDLAKRLKRHLIGKSWWERVVILTTSDDSLNRSDIDYIEANLISKASEIGRLDCDNKNMGNKQKVTKFRAVELKQYLEEALFLLELIGVNVFCESADSRAKSKLIPSVKNSSKEQIEIREKKEAFQFLAEHRITVIKNSNYAKRQENRPVFRINPHLNSNDNDWGLVLNDQIECQLIYIHIPKGSFVMKTDEKQGLVMRHKPDRIDLSISSETFVDQRNNCDFSPYIIKKIKY